MLERELGIRVQINASVQALVGELNNPALDGTGPAGATALAQLAGQAQSLAASLSPTTQGFDLAMRIFNFTSSAPTLSLPWMTAVEETWGCLNVQRVACGLPADQSQLPTWPFISVNPGFVHLLESVLVDQVFGTCIGWWITLGRIALYGDLNVMAFPGDAAPRVIALLTTLAEQALAASATVTAVDGLHDGVSAAASAAADAADLATRLAATATPIADPASARTVLAALGNLASSAWPQLAAPGVAYRDMDDSVLYGQRMNGIRDAYTAVLAAVALEPDSCPAALLPLRLETALVDLDDHRELCVRIFPDDLHVDSHDPTLTAVEQIWAAALQAATASPDDAAADLWAQGVARFGAYRTAYLNRAPAAEITATARKSIWARPARAAVTADRWLAVAYDVDGSVMGAALGADIIEPLPLTVDPMADAVDGGVGDAGMAWMHDYVAALQSGWAVTITLGLADGVIAGMPGTLSPARVARVVVVGVAAGDSAAALGDLLTAHRYTDGLALLAPDTPTNNLAGAGSGYTTDDPGGRNSYEREVLAPSAAAPLDAPNAGNDDTSRLYSALGLDVDLVDGVFAGAGPMRTDSLDTQAMTALIWPVTWGGYLRRINGGAGDAMVPTVRGFAEGYLLPGGPLPALRVGRQPYGILPALSLGEFVDDAAQPSVIDTIATIVHRAVDYLAAVTPVQDNGSLDDLLSTRAVSAAVSARAVVTPLGDGSAGSWITAAESVLGEKYSDMVAAATALDIEANHVAGVLGTLSPRLPQASVLLPRPALAGPGIGHRAFALSAPLVDADASAPAVDYLAELATTGTPPSGSLLAELAAYCWQSAGATATAPPAPLRGRGALDGTADPPVDDGGERDDLAPAAAWLARRPVADVTRLLGGALDATSHRVDAWATALATYRLAQLRAGNPSRRLVAGGYGWVEGIVQADPLTPDATDATLLHDDAVDGYLAAPSVAQATTVAVLHSAYRRHNPAAEGVTPPADAPFAIDLSSRRARLATSILDGLKQGHTLAAQLGYRFERHLIEQDDGANADLVAVFRRLAPLAGTANQVTSWPVGGPQPQEDVPVSDVADGVTIHQLWRSLTDQAGTPSGAWARAADALNELEETVDAVTDAVTATALHHMLAGNTATAAATLDAVATGVVAADAREFLATPRTGTQIVHRVLIAAPPTAALPAGWAADTPKTACAPGISTWAAARLGDPGAAQASVSFQDTSGNPIGDPVPVTITDLEVGPLDLLDLAQRPLDLNQALINAAASGDEPAANAEVDLAPADANRPLAHVLDVAVELAAVLASARPADGRDLHPIADGVTDPGVNLGEVAARAAAARTALNDALTAMRTAFPGRPDPDGATPPADLGAADATPLRTALAAAAGLGVPGAVTASASAPQVADPLDARAYAAWSELVQRDRAASTVVTDGGTDTDRLVASIAVVRAVFGSTYPIAALTLAPPTADDGPDLSAVPAGHDPTAWLLKHAHVHPELDRLVNALSLAEVLDGPQLELAIAQYPTGQNWAGAPFAGAPPADGTLCLAFAGALPSAPAELLVVRDLPELIPSAVETAAVTYHFPSPAAQAPQAIVLAVPAEPPTATSTWNYLGLLGVLTSTRTLARVRPTRPVSTLLPASVVENDPFDRPALTGVPDSFLAATALPVLTAANVDGTGMNVLRPGTRHAVVLTGSNLAGATLTLAQQGPRAPSVVSSTAGGDSTLTAVIDVPSPADPGSCAAVATNPTTGITGPAAGILTVAAPALATITPTMIGQVASASTPNLTIAGIGLLNATATLYDPASTQRLHNFRVVSTSPTAMVCAVDLDASSYEPSDEADDLAPAAVRPARLPDGPPQPPPRHPRPPRHTPHTVTVTISPTEGNPLTIGLALDVVT